MERQQNLLLQFLQVAQRRELLLLKLLVSKLVPVPKTGPPVAAAYHFAETPASTVAPRVTVPIPHLILV